MLVENWAVTPVESDRVVLDRLDRMPHFIAGSMCQTSIGTPSKVLISLNIPSKSVSFEASGSHLVCFPNPT